MTRSFFYDVVHATGFLSVLVFDFSDLQEVLAALLGAVLLGHRIYLFGRDMKKAREEDLKKSQDQRTKE